MTDKPFLTDVKTLRERARRHIEEGAVTEGYTGNRENVINILNEALATEIVCNLRYKSHYFRADGLNASVAAQEFLEHAEQEQRMPTGWQNVSSSSAASPTFPPKAS